MKINIEKQRKIWEKVAKNNGWYKEPFFVQVWVDIENKKIVDSVSFIGLKRDLIINYKTEEVIK
tara:strand:+ start:41 stop:232 length:192 start_codon:yes stop_codon:yes gene_type:complete